MNKPTSWDCMQSGCATRNAAIFSRCRRCGRPPTTGQFIYPQMRPTAPRPRTAPAPVDSADQLDASWIPGIIVAGIALFAFDLGYFVLLVAFFALLTSIACGVWRIAGRKP